MAFRQKWARTGFADIAFAPLNATRRPLSVAPSGASASSCHPSVTAHGRLVQPNTAQGSRGVHEYAVEDFGITAGASMTGFRFYTDHFDVTPPCPHRGAGRARSFHEKRNERRRRLRGLLR